MNRQEVAVEIKQNQTMVSPLKDVLHFFSSLHPPIPCAGLKQMKALNPPPRWWDQKNHPQLLQLRGSPQACLQAYPQAFLQLLGKAW